MAHDNIFIGIWDHDFAVIALYELLFGSLLWFQFVLRFQPQTNDCFL